MVQMEAEASYDARVHARITLTTSRVRQLVVKRSYWKVAVGCSREVPMWEVGQIQSVNGAPP